MKFTEYITEASKKELQTYSVIKSLEKHCQPIIKELRKHGDVLWRGASKSKTKSIIQVTPRTDRQAKDMAPEVQYELDNWFEKKFGWRPRSEGVFATGSKNMAYNYGDGPPYMFFPIGKFEFLYSPSINDLYSDIEGEQYYGFIANGELDEYEYEYEWEREYGEGGEGEYYYDEYQQEKRIYKLR